MTNEIPKFPRRDSINMECSMIIGDYEKWRVDARKQLEKEIAEAAQEKSEIFIANARYDFLRGYIQAREELLEALK